MVHTRSYGDQLMRHNFCLAFPGDGWSSRVLKKTEKTPAHTSTFVTPHSPPADDLVFQVLDALVHGCIPVIVQDESDMFFEGAFREAGLAIEYADFSVRLAEAQLPQLVQMLLDIPRERVVALRRTALWVCTPPKTSCLPASPARLPGPPPRPAAPAHLSLKSAPHPSPPTYPPPPPQVRDYFVYKHMWSPHMEHRAELGRLGRQGQDGFLLLALSLEAKVTKCSPATSFPHLYVTRLVFLDLSHAPSSLFQGESAREARRGWHELVKAETRMAPCR